MEIQFLGTGSGVPAKHRNVSSLALKLLDEINEIWLFDCGEATQHQILRTTLKPRKVTKIFITHMHGDHIFGLPGFLSSRAFQGGDSPLTIYGPKGIKDYVLMSLKLSKSFLKYPLHFVEFKDGDQLLKTEQFSVTVQKVSHGIDSFGFRIEEKDHQGTLDAKALKELGVPFGPLYGKLKNGETVTLKDGSVVNGKDYIGPDIKGRKLAIIGDTKPCKNAYDIAKDVDVLVHEGTFNHDDKDLAYAYNHSTNVQAAELALKAKVGTLLLTHISSRYLADDVKVLEKQAREVFKESYLMYDFKEYEIKYNN